MTAFLKASSSEVSEWRNLAMTRAFIEWIKGEIEEAKRAQHNLLARDEVGKARIACGYIDALTHIVDGMSVPAALPDLMTEEFFDPAARPKREKK